MFVCDCSPENVLNDDSKNNEIAAENNDCSKNNETRNENVNDNSIVIVPNYDVKKN